MKSSSVPQHRRPGFARGVKAVTLTVALAVGPLFAGLFASSASASDAGSTTLIGQTPPAKVATAAEQQQADRIPMSEVVAKSVPLKMPQVTSAVPTKGLAPMQNGTPQVVAGIAPRTRDVPTGITASAMASAMAGSVLGNVWPGAYNANPNRQVGKLYYDTDPGVGVTWNHCSATAINTANKSLILTAGHCVFNSDPDVNGRVDGNGYYYQDFRFCPGYEFNSCKLGTWYYRTAATTPSWYYGVGSAHTYDWSDDIAVILMKPNASGYLVNVVGGQGIAFNQPVNQTRTAMGYPISDTRWPQYKFSGEDLIYCQGVDSLAASRTKIWLPCRMTGGASGGPWLTQVNSQWLGIVISVNSHKPYGAEYMEGPYFDNAEGTLFNTYRSA